MYEVRDKVFLVTGGAAGIGAAICRALLNEGAKHVAILDCDSKNGTALENELKIKYNKKVKFHKCDITTKDLDDAYDDIIKEFGYIDTVVNCAGVMNDNLDHFRKSIEINVTALIASSLRAYNLMRKDRKGKGGTIINISSICSIVQYDFAPIYGATKSAVMQFSNCLGGKPHFDRSGVRVITICFGATDTSIIQNTKYGGIDEETNQNIANFIEMFPLQRADSAAKGTIYAYKNGNSGSTWLVEDDRPAEDITSSVTKGYEIMGEKVSKK